MSMSELTSEEKTTIATYDKQAESWSTNHSITSFWGDEMARFNELLPIGKLLEIGAGGGRDAKELIERGYDYLGTNISSGLLEQARENNPGVNFEQVSVYDLDYKELFDGFWCVAVLLHIPREKIDSALSAINKSMKRGAIGFIAIKEGDGEQLEATNANTGGDERYFVYWSDNDFSNKLADNGFTIVERDNKPMNERTQWLTYIVQVADKLDSTQNS
jgi:SAM-dependent methyltransferase